MAYKQHKNYRSKNGGTKSGDYVIKTFEGSIPSPEKTSEASLTYNVKAFRDLQNVGAIELKADPNAAITRGSYPYNIIARTNKVVEANYSGRENIEGNILTRLQNSNDSLLLNTFDLATINFRVNYLYLCYGESDVTKHNNVAVNMEMNKALNEALSKGYSTMMTALPYYTDDISTNMPMPKPYENDSTLKSIYGKLGGLLHYQTVLQNAVSPISKYIETMSLEQTALNMSFRRESPTITALYGLLKKSAFKATLNAVGSNIIGEYFDTNWYRQMNTMAYTPSRKSNSMSDPLLTATMTTCIPSCLMKTQSGVTYYDSASILKAKGIWVNPDTWTFDGTTDKPVEISFEDLIYRLNRMLDVSTILTWARKLNTAPSSVGTITSPSAYYQSIVKMIEAINLILTSFTTAMTNIRTFIDKLDTSNMVYWKKGVSLSVSNITVYDPTFNVILHNLIAAYIGGSSTMTYDQNTQRWQAATLWNKYTGIAEFDRMSGGSFLTFGLRKLDTTGLADTDTAMCLPIVFSAELKSGYSKCVATTRLGLVVSVTSREVTDLSEDRVLSRLDPLMVKFPIKIPAMNINISGLKPDEKARVASSAQQFLLTIAGYGSTSVDGTNYYAACDPDYVCFLDVQISDVSNEMIQFCRNYSPFRVSTPDGKRTIGFGAK